MAHFIDKRCMLEGNPEMCPRKGGLKWKEPKCVGLRSRDWTFLSNTAMIEMFYVVTADNCLLDSDAV